MGRIHIGSESGPKTAITVKNANKSYGTVLALRDVDLDVEAGTIMALLGPNGAGKTTLVRVLTTLTRPDSGELTVGGYDVTRNPAAVRTVIGLAGQSAAIDETLTGRENLVMVGRLYHLDKATAKSRAAKLLDQFELTDAGGRVAKTYSGGMRRRLDLAASLVGEPDILFLDEPTTGLDPRSRLDLWETIQGLVNSGVTVLLTTQYLEEADYLADRIAVIDDGQIIAEGTPDELKSMVGGDVLELRVSDRSQTDAAVTALSGIGSGDIQGDQETGRITVPVSDGTAFVAQVIRELDRKDIQISDFNLRRPSLDEVFLTLTGKSTPDNESNDENPKKSRFSRKRNS